MSEKKKNGFFAKHAKSSAAMISLGIHAVLILIAVSFVAVTVIQKEDKKFEAKQVSRPKQRLKKLQVPVKVKKNKPKPKLRKRVVVKNVQRKMPEFKMPEISGVKGGLAGLGGDGGGMESIGFSMPELDFFGAKAKGEKVVFVVHFGPATIGKTSLERMTGYTIRKRLEDLVNGMPEYTLFNVAAYYSKDNWAMSPKMMLATPDNKQMVMDWMAPVNPLEGDYKHCFYRKEGTGFYRNVEKAYENYPTRLEKKMPIAAPKWIYPYEVPSDLNKKYLGGDSSFSHWSRGVAWAIIEQQPDTIFVLTTNYLGPDANEITRAYKKMFRDYYGPDRKKHPTINVVVLKHKGDPNKILNEQYGEIWQSTNGKGSVIEDITKYMNDAEKELYTKYKSSADSE